VFVKVEGEECAYVCKNEKQHQARDSKESNMLLLHRDQKISKHKASTALNQELSRDIPQRLCSVGGWCAWWR
jgi:hypothetical protein